MSKGETEVERDVERVGGRQKVEYDEKREREMERRQSLRSGEKFVKDG